MKITRWYRSLLLTSEENDRIALNAFKESAWREPEEGDQLRDTVLSRKRLDFYRKLVRDGRLSDHH